MNIEKNIWLIWLQGWDEAPEIVKACLASWQAFNPDWQIHPLTRETVFDHIQHTPELDDIIAKNLPPEALTNFLRLELLKRHGGVWADATLFCLRPLDDWIFSATESGFFAFEKPGPGRMVSTWFMAAQPDSLILQVWQDACYTYWHDRSERHTYHWMHNLFGELYEARPDFAGAWDAVLKLSADGPHYFIPHSKRLMENLRNIDRDVIMQARVPLLKLNFKIPYQSAGAESRYRFLCNYAETLTNRDIPVLPPFDLAVYRRHVTMHKSARKPPFWESYRQIFKWLVKARS